MSYSGYCNWPNQYITLKSCKLKHLYLERFVKGADDGLQAGLERINKRLEPGWPLHVPHLDPAYELLLAATIRWYGSYVEE